MDLNELRDKAYKNACEHGFHEKEYSDDHYLMLVICELAEAVEADRSNYWNRHAKVDYFKKKIETSRICQGLDPTISKECGYEVAYNETIKGSIEEKLADTVIRLLDLAGLRGIDLSDVYTPFTTSKELPEFIFLTIRRLYKTPLDCAIYDVISNIFMYCNTMKIDLLWYIEMKMKYNELREYKHGKKY